MSVTKIIYKFALFSLLPLAFYDFLTSWFGARAIIKAPDNVPQIVSIIVLFMPFVIGIAAVAFNALFLDLYHDWRRSPLVFCIAAAFLIYDIYTTLLGVANLVGGGSGIIPKHTNLATAFSDLSGERAGFAILCSALISVSPMCALWLGKKIDNQPDNNYSV